MSNRPCRALLVFLILATGCGDPADINPGDTIGDTGSGADMLPAMPLRTQDRWIVDADGKRVKLAGYNWNKGEGPDFTMSGLQAMHRNDIAAKLQELGFNSVRLVWSNELVESNPVIDAKFLTANPDLVGMTALEVMDAVVRALADHGIMIIMNNHISDGIYCCKSDDENTLWYNERFPESAWIQDWRTIALRYRDEPAVIGADLRNEPRFFAYFGSDAGDEFDWAAAAERGGNAVLSEAPHWLIFVEGINYAQDLINAKDRPIVLNMPNRLVYSIHDYPWFGENLTPTEMVSKWEKNWAFLFKAQASAAPVWVGEFGLCNTCWNAGDQTQVWFDTFIQFVRDNDLDWSWWMMHGADNPFGWGMFDQTTGEPWSQGLMEIHQSLIAPVRGPGVSF